ncbi:MAG: malectin domain-containing carbohydrate-binding protein, partial [Bacteroidota bacterium]
FETERFDGPGGEELQYFIPLSNDDYIVKLYLVNSWPGTSGPGERIFGISIEDQVVESTLDLITTFGHQVGGVLEYPITLTDGELNIEFLHGAVNNPLINAIEIFGPEPQFGPIQVDPIADQNNFINDLVDNLAVNASGGNPLANFLYTISGQPTGVSIEPTNGQIFGTIAPSAITGGPNGDGIHDVAVTVSKTGSLPVTVNFTWTVTATVPPTISFTPPGDQSMLEGESLNVDLVITDADGNLTGNTTISGPPFMGETNTQNTANNYVSNLSFNPQPGDAGNYTITVTTSDGINNPVSASFNLAVFQDFSTCEVLYRVNSGGSELTDPDGNWTEDTGASPNPYLVSGNLTFTTGQSITNFTGYPTSLFQSERWHTGTTLSYAFPAVPGGEYEVRLLFAEIYADELTDPRVFDIEIEGTLVADDFRISTEAGGLFTALVKTYTVTTSDNSLNIDLQKVSQNPAIKGIEICLINEPTSFTITASAGANGSISPAGSVVVAQGGDQTFTITPDTDFIIDEVLVNGVAQGPISTFTFTDVQADATIAASFAPAPLSTIYVNAGGGAFTTQDGRVFAADNGFSGGTVYPTEPGPIATLAATDFANTDDDELFRTERFGNYSYSFPVINGDYIVDLYFTELFLGVIGGTPAPGARVFDVDVEGGSPELVGLDLLDPANGGAFAPATGIIKSF